MYDSKEVVVRDQYQNHKSKECFEAEVIVALAFLTFVLKKCIKERVFNKYYNKEKVFC